MAKERESYKAALASRQINLGSHLRQSRRRRGKREPAAVMTHNHTLYKNYAYFRSKGAFFGRRHVKVMKAHTSERGNLRDFLSITRVCVRVFYDSISSASSKVKGLRSCLSSFLSNYSTPPPSLLLYRPFELK
jgi:hypothetical protein